MEMTEQDIAAIRSLIVACDNIGGEHVEGWQDLIDAADKVREIVRSEDAEKLLGCESLILSHEACDAFWDYWEENGATHKHGYYESTWGAIVAYMKRARGEDTAKLCRGGDE
jgi:hypothetical protein